MRIGIVSLSDVDFGLNLANALDSAGESVHLYLSRHHAFLSLGDNPHVLDSFYTLGLLSCEIHLYLFDAPHMRDPRSFATMRRLCQTMKDDDIQVAHLLVGSGEFWLAILAWLLKIPVCSTMIIPKPNIGDHPPAPIVTAVNQLLAWNSEIVVVNGKNQISMVEKMYHFPTARVDYVPLIPRTTTLHYATKNISEEMGLILFFGRVDLHKGTEYLVRAQPLINSRISEARIVIAGHGPEFEHCRQLIQDQNQFELYEGFITNEFTARLFQRASIVVLPYLTASTSGVLSTAQTFGKAVVATQVGSLAEYIEDGVTGLLVPPANVEKLANAIVYLLQNSELRHQMGRNALSRVLTTQEECVTQSLSALEKSIIYHRKGSKDRLNRFI